MIYQTALIVMAKQPHVGLTKTRLCPPFSPIQAAEFYEAMLLDTLELAASLPGVQLAAAITPAQAHQYFATITPAQAIIIPVEGANIGECLEQAFDHLITSGFTKVLALNTDGPTLPPAYLSQAINLLEKSDVVLGPGEDGGYYLIGMKHKYPELFQEISWSTPQVLNQTLVRIESLGLTAAFTPAWYDVDTAQDAARLADELQHLSPDRLIFTRRFFENLPPKTCPV